MKTCAPCSRKVYEKGVCENRSMIGDATRDEICCLWVL